VYSFYKELSSFYITSCNPSKRNYDKVAGNEINNVSKNTDDNVGAF